MYENKDIVMIRKFTKKQFDFFYDKEIFYIGIAQEFRNGNWNIYSWEYYKRKKLSNNRLIVVQEDDKTERLIITRNDIDSGFIKFK